MAEFNVDGLIAEKQELESLMMTNPEMEKKVQKLVRKVINKARATLSASLRNDPSVMKSDPRAAYKAVKAAVYRQVFGGNVSILDKKRRATSFSSYHPPRKLKEGQRGGNRMQPSERTRQLQSYYGADRAFILRFLNDGTEERESSIGKRGRIKPRNFFGPRSQKEIKKAAEQLTQLIDELIKQEMR